MFPGRWGQFAYPVSSAPQFANHSSHLLKIRQQQTCSRVQNCELCAHVLRTANANWLLWPASLGELAQPQLHRGISLWKSSWAKSCWFASSLITSYSPDGYFRTGHRRPYNGRSEVLYGMLNLEWTCSDFQIPFMSVSKCWPYRRPERLSDR
jgi:hypothetical protein